MTYQLVPCEIKDCTRMHGVRSTRPASRQAPADFAAPGGATSGDARALAEAPVASPPVPATPAGDDASLPLGIWSMTGTTTYSG